MLKKEITYKNFDGETVSDTFYFNLNKAEMAELELGRKGGMQAYFQQIIDEEDNQKILEAFKKIIRLAVGRRTPDGKRFLKNDEITSDLFDTNAYSELFIQLMTDADYAAKFVTGIIPADLLASDDNNSDTPSDKETERKKLEAQLKALES